jgi:hypothetical protein
MMRKNWSVGDMVVLQSCKVKTATSTSLQGLVISVKLLKGYKVKQLTAAAETYCNYLTFLTF